MAARTVTWPPVGVNLRPLPTKFESTWDSRWPSMGRPAGTSIAAESRMPFCSATGAMVMRTSSTTAR